MKTNNQFPWWIFVIVFCAVKFGPRLFQNTQNIPITSNFSSQGFKSFQQVVEEYKTKMMNDPNAITNLCYEARNSPSLLGKSYEQYLNEQIRKHLSAKTSFNTDMAVKYTANKQLFKQYCPGTF